VSRVPGPRHPPKLTRAACVDKLRRARSGNLCTLGCELTQRGRGAPRDGGRNEVASLCSGHLEDVPRLTDRSRAPLTARTALACIEEQKLSARSRQLSARGHFQHA